MNFVDALIAVAALLFAWLGWHNGFVRSFWGFVGLMAGTAVGIVLTPNLLGSLDLSVWLSIGALILVGTTAIAGRFLAVAVETMVRSDAPWQPDPRIDRPAGVLFGVVATLLVSWMLGLAVAGSTLPYAAENTNGSWALRQLDRVPLPFGDALVTAFVSLGDEVDYARYVDPLTPEDITPVRRPDPAVAKAPGVERASASTYKVIGHKGGLDGSQGTVFVVGRGLLMTAAHVVNGTSRLEVLTEQGEVDATVVACDPEHDVAVLSADVDGRPLAFAESAEHGDDAAAIGFPLNGDLTITPVRVRDRQDFQAADINGKGRYESDVYAVRGRIHHGNSGGPVVTPDGRVLGVVVAYSRTSRDTAYVNTASQVAATLAAAVRLPRVRGETNRPLGNRCHRTAPIPK